MAGLCLLVSHDEASEKIKEQVARGRTLIAEAQTTTSLSSTKGRCVKWRDYVHLMLKQLFSVEDFAQEFKAVGTTVGRRINRPAVSEKNELLAIIRARVLKLESIDERLGLLRSEAPPNLIGRQTVPGRKIFIVHGRDEAAKQALARFLEATDFEPVILHEQADHGKTVIEKFETNSDVAFAVVLMTPDDVGSLADNPGAGRLRARQNVILELGYFVGRLGRNRVLVLTKGDLEIPSDYVGVVYTIMDELGAWKTKLAKELNAAGLKIDFQKAAHA
jgi:predicted nucleotide-binding protein